MPNQKISELDSASVPLSGAEVIPVVQSGTTKKVTVSNLLSNSGLTPIASNTLLGNNTGSTATPAALTAAQTRTLLGLAASATTDTTNAGNITSGTLQTGRLPAIPDQTILGNNSGVVAAPSSLTASQVKQMLGFSTTDDRTILVGDSHAHMGFTYTEVTNSSTIPSWTRGHAYVTSPTPSKVANNGQIYICTTAGTSATTATFGAGPSGTGTGITDGTCVWSWYSAPCITVQGGEIIMKVTNTRDNNGTLVNHYISPGNKFLLAEVRRPQSWKPSTQYNFGDYVMYPSINGNTYKLRSSVGISSPDNPPTGQGYGIVDQNPSNPSIPCVWDYVGTPASVIAPQWTVSTSYYTGNRISNGGSVYECISTGISASTGSGPSGTSTSITDGTTKWTYIANSIAGFGDYPMAFICKEPKSIPSYGEIRISSTISTSPDWTQLRAYQLNEKVSANGYVYNCVQAGVSGTSGGPSGTGTAITDGSAKWDFYSTPLTIPDGTDLSTDRDWLVTSMTQGRDSSVFPWLNAFASTPFNVVGVYAITGARSEHIINGLPSLQAAHPKSSYAHVHISLGSNDTANCADSSLSEETAYTAYKNIMYLADTLQSTGTVWIWTPCPQPSAFPNTPYNMNRSSNFLRTLLLNTRRSYRLVVLDMYGASVDENGYLLPSYAHYWSDNHWGIRAMYRLGKNLAQQIRNLYLKELPFQPQQAISQFDTNLLPTWSANKLYTKSRVVTYNHNTYICTATGTSGSAAPLSFTNPGVAYGITDGTCTWDYAGPMAFNLMQYGIMSGINGQMSGTPTAGKITTWSGNIPDGWYVLNNSSSNVSNLVSKAAQPIHNVDSGIDSNMGFGWDIQATFSQGPKTDQTIGRLVLYTNNITGVKPGCWYQLRMTISGVPGTSNNTVLGSIGAYINITGLVSGMTSFVQVMMPGNSVQAYSNPWSQNTSYATNDIVTANNTLWQCVTGGTSSSTGTGPSGNATKTTQQATFNSGSTTITLNRTNANPTIGVGQFVTDASFPSGTGPIPADTYVTAVGLGTLGNQITISNATTGASTVTNGDSLVFDLVKDNTVTWRWYSSMAAMPLEMTDRYELVSVPIFIPYTTDTTPACQMSIQIDSTAQGTVNFQVSNVSFRAVFNPLTAPA